MPVGWGWVMGEGLLNNPERAGGRGGLVVDENLVTALEPADFKSSHGGLSGLLTRSQHVKVQVKEMETHTSVCID